MSRIAAFPVATLIVTLVVTGCGITETSTKENGAWVGTITTEGDVTTVVNDSGSLWGGTATLVEEASIGVAMGPEEYMFGRVNGIVAHDDRIFVLDAQVPTIRVYDLDGMHLYDIGRGGEGPGEFGKGLRGPAGLAADEDGRIYVQARTKIEIFSAGGEHLDSWPLGGTFSNEGDFSLAVPGPGTVLLADTPPCGEGLRRWRCPTGLLSIEEGVVGEDLRLLPDLGLEEQRLVLELSIAGGWGVNAATVPFTPENIWNLDSSGAILIGRSDRYEIHRYTRDGTRTVITKYWAPVPVEEDEAAWYLRRERLRSQLDAVTSVSGYDLDDGLPETKPAFEQFVPGHDGSLWVVRPGPGQKLSDCAEHVSEFGPMSARPCWRDRILVDAFAPDGRYRGKVAVPEILGNERYGAFDPQPFIDGDSVLIQVQDEAGTLRVKRYGLLLPGEDTR